MMVRPLANKGERVFNVAEDITLLTELIESKPDHKFKLLIIDPINSYMGGTDTWKAAEVRTVLAPLGNWSEKQSVSTLFLSHLSKGGKGAALNCVLDSGAFTAVCRSGLVCRARNGGQSRDRHEIFRQGQKQSRAAEGRTHLQNRK